MKYTLIVIAILAIIGALSAYLYFGPGGSKESYTPTQKTDPAPKSPAREEVTPPAPAEEAEATPTPTEREERSATTEIGTSVGARSITAYHFGSGDREVLFVGGIHGGYSWNTTAVAYELIKHLTAQPSLVPSGFTVTVIPVLNPDGLAEVTDKTGALTKTDISATEGERVAARFNEHTVDLNRNFDCEWKQSAVWQSKTVSGGSAAFSEPESQALRDYVDSHDIQAAVIWYSAAGGVYASACGGVMLPDTRTLMNVFAKAAGYPAHNEFDSYEVSGDAANWLSKKGVPTFSVLLTTHDTTDWEKNRKGVEALLSALSE